MPRWSEPCVCGDMVETHSGHAGACTRVLPSGMRCQCPSFLSRSSYKSTARMAPSKAFVNLSNKINHWVRSRFGDLIFEDRWERTMRVLEEALELAQAEGVSEDAARILTRRVFSRPVGVPSQEGAGVGVTLFAWAASRGIDIHKSMMEEVERIYAVPVEKFIEKQKEKARAGVALPPKE